MKISTLGAFVLAFVSAAWAQCPVSPDNGTCTTADKPAKSSAQAGTAKPSQKSKTTTRPQAQIQNEDSITRTQADAILVELKEIHALLLKQQPAPPKIDFSKIDFDAQPLVKLAPDNRRDNSMGEDEAPVVIVEYSDYQCPHCAKFQGEMFDAIKIKYIATGKVRFISRDFPFPSHPWAMIAAEAARCAGEQQKYWPMREELMRRSEELSATLIDQIAQAQHLDIPRYRVCMESRKFYSDIQSDKEAGLAAQIFGTPGFIIGKATELNVEGKRVLGAPSLPDFEKLIDEALAEKK